MWHIRGILHNQKLSSHVASGSSCTGVTNMKIKCEITLKNYSEFVPVCHLWKRANELAQILFIPLVHLQFCFAFFLHLMKQKTALNLGWKSS